jgi:hypothetical protein
MTNQWKSDIQELGKLFDELARYGTKTRRGMPCRCHWVYASGRCKFYGGLSTGPKTEAGRRRAL